MLVENRSPGLILDQLKGLGLGLSQPDIDLSDRESALENLNSFLRSANKDSKLLEVIDRYLNNDDLQPYQFYLTDAYTSLLSKEIHERKFGSHHWLYPDGDFTFILGFERGRHRWGIGGISFSSTDRIEWLGKEGGGFSIPNSPVIVQNQGIKSSVRPPHGLRWEKVLYELIIEWAASNNFPAVYVQPSRRNEYYDKPISTHAPGESIDSRIARARKGLEMRYDVTPSRLGFISETTGLHALHLAYPNG